MFSNEKSLQFHSLLLFFNTEILSNSDTIDAIVSILTSCGAAIVFFKQIVTSLAGFHIQTIPVAQKTLPGQTTGAMLEDWQMDS